MKITENMAIPDYDTGYVYRITVVTDSSIERDIIQKHLAQVKEEYSNWIRKQTKGEINNGK